MIRYLKKITMTLNPKSIENAIKEVRHFQKQLKPAMQHLIDRLAAKGIEVARAELVFFTNGNGDFSTGDNANPAYDTGRLSESIYYKTTEVGAVIIAGEGLHNAMGDVDSESYAYYVEYGNGYTRAGGWWYPAPWGWWTPKEGKHAGEPMAYAPGMKPRPFMGHTLLDLTEEARTVGGEIIAEYIKDHR